ncbi:hypothetical protein ACWEFL_17250 [Streptomyces sp. NPDC004838]
MGRELRDGSARMTSGPTFPFTPPVTQPAEPPLAAGAVPQAAAPATDHAVVVAVGSFRHGTSATSTSGMSTNGATTNGATADGATADGTTAGSATANGTGATDGTHPPHPPHPTAEADEFEETPLVGATGFPELDFAHERGTAVGDSLTALGYRLHGGAVLTDPTLALARTSLDDAVRRTPADGGLVVHLISHGHTDPSGSLRIALADSGPDGGLDVESWLRDLEREERPAALIMLDVCHAGAAVRWQWNNWSMRLRAEARSARARRAWVLAAAAPEEKAFNGRFSEAVASVLKRLHADGLETDSSLEYVPVSHVAREIRTTLDRLWRDAKGVPQHLDSTPLALGEEPALRLFRNPRFAPTPLARLRLGAEDSLRGFLAELDPVLDAYHYITRAFGARDDSVGSCLFSGRTAELDVLTPWLNSASPSPSLVVVTGGPGTGKSALLGLLVCAAQPRLRSALLQRLPPVRLPGRATAFAAVHARGRDAVQLAASIGRQLKLPETAAGWTPVRLVEALRRRADRGHPVVTVVVDALDEAVSPADVVDLLLLPLSRTGGKKGGRPVCRLLIGTRTVDDASAVVDGARRHGLLLDLDEADQTVLRDDVAGFVRRHLELSPLYDSGAQEPLRERLSGELAAALVPDDADAGTDTGTAGTGTGATQTGGTDTGTGRDADTGTGTGTRTRTGADTGTTHANRPGPYLLARLYLHQLLDAEYAIGLSGIDEVISRAPRTIADMLELDLARIGDPWARPLLVAIAHAKHPGIPASLARVIAPAMNGAPVAAGSEPNGVLPAASIPDAAETLERVGFYLRRTADPEGPTLYRLFHQELVDHLRVLPAADGRSTAGGEVAHTVLRTLLSPLRRDPEGPVQWGLALPYQARHALEHARDARRADALVADPEFLIHTGPPAAALDDLSDEAARELAAVYRMSGDRHRAADPVARRSVLALDAMRSGRSGLAALLVGGTRDMADGTGGSVGGTGDGTGGLGGWSPLWASGSAGEEAPVALLRGAPGAARFVTIAVHEGRAMVLASGVGWTRTWDLATAQQIFLGRWTRMLRRRATFQLAADTHEEVLPPHVSRLQGRFRIGRGTFTFYRPDGSKVRFSGDSTGELAIVDNRVGVTPVHGASTPSSEPPSSEPDGTEPDGTGSDGTQTDDAAPHSADPTNPADATVLPGFLTAAAEQNGEPLLAIALDSGEIRLLDLAGPRLLLPPRLASDGAMHSLALYATGEDRAVVLAATTAGPVTWDVPLRGQPSTAAADPAGPSPEPSAPEPPDPPASSEESRPPFLPTAVARPGDGLTQEPGPVTLVANPEGGLFAAVATGGSVTLRPVDGHGGDRILGGSARSLTALGSADRDGRPLVVGGSADGTLRVWDLSTPRAPEAGMRHPGPVTAVARGSFGGRRVLFSASGDEVWVRELLTGRTVGRLATGQVGVTALAFTRLGRRPVLLTAGADWTVRIWDAERRTPVGRPLTGYAGRVATLAVGRLEGRPVVATGGDDNAIAVWDLLTQSLIGEHPTAHDAPVTGLVFTSGGIGTSGDVGAARLASCGEDGAVRFWELTAETLAQRSVAYSPAAVTCAEAADGLVLTGGAERTVRLWDAESGDLMGEPLTGHSGAVCGLTVGRFAGVPAAFTLGTDATLRTWDLHGRPRAVLDLPSPGTGPVWAAPGRIALGLGRDLVVLGETHGG